MTPRSRPTAATSPSSPTPTTSAPTTRKAAQTDIFVRDLDTNVTELVSRASGATGAASAEYSFEPSISADGKRVAFTSRGALVGDDVDEESFPQDVFVRDRASATTILVSRKSGAAGTPSEVESDEPAISADGRHVAFASSAKLTGEKYFDPRVFVRDLDTETVQLVSVGDEGKAGDGKRSPSISADGRFVAFQTRGDKVSPVDADARVDVFVRDMTKRLTVTVSRASGRLGVPADGPSFDPSVSADGTLVAFDSHATNLSGADEDRFADVFLRPCGLRDRAGAAALRRPRRDDRRHPRSRRPAGNQPQGRDRRPRRRRQGPQLLQGRRDLRRGGSRRGRRRRQRRRRRLGPRPRRAGRRPRHPRS